METNGATAFKVVWLAFTDQPLCATGRQLLLQVADAGRNRSRIDLASFSHPEILTPEVLALAPPLREEVKSHVRKRSRRAGNIRHPFLVVSQTEIPFEVQVLVDSSARTILRLEANYSGPAFPLTRLADVAAAPSNDRSQVHWAVQKVLAALAAGDPRARPDHMEPITHIYPIIHCRRLVGPDGQALDDLPWTELAEVGTRHRSLSERDTDFVDGYRRKNTHFREGEATVIDKQSTLLVGPGNRLEFTGIEHTVLLGLTIQHVLERSFRHRHQGIPPAVAQLARDTLFSAAHPAVVTESETHHRHWPNVLRETQAIRWAEALLEASPNVRPPPEDGAGSRAILGSDTLQALTSLEHRLGSLQHTVADLAKLVSDGHIKAALGHARSMLEEVVAREYALTHRGESKEPQTLRHQVDWMKTSGRLPKNLHADMVWLVEHGNTGAHPNAVSIEQLSAAAGDAFGILRRIFRWHVEDFLPSVSCPRCAASVHVQSHYCSMCGARQPRTKTHCCNARLPEGARFCDRCGEATSMPVS
ncbi:MAG: Double zinc ribbon [Pseudomonadota bacterium]|jgi:hypothetical protein